MLTDKITYWTGRASGRWCARWSSASCAPARELKLFAETRPRGRLPGRADRVRHHARDELPDARDASCRTDRRRAPRNGVRTRRRGAPWPSSGSACCTTTGGTRTRSAPKGRRPKRKAPDEDVQEVYEALKKAGHNPVFLRLDGTRESLIELAALRDRPDLQPGRVLRRRRHPGQQRRRLPRAAAAAASPAPARSGLYLAQDKALAKKIFAFHGIHTPVLRHRVSAAAPSTRTTSSSR